MTIHVTSTRKSGEPCCPSHSKEDVIPADEVGPPGQILQESYQFLGNQTFPYDRCTSPEFFDLAMEHMWLNAWQWACREDEIPEAGDYMV